MQYAKRKLIKIGTVQVESHNLEARKEAIKQ